MGFVISRKLKSYIRGFCQVNERIASLKIKCRGGNVALVAVLAPHNLRPQCEKWDFYEKLDRVMSGTSTNGPNFVFGDLNARIGQQRPGEHRVVGPHSFGIEAQFQVEMPSRDFLMEFCHTTTSRSQTLSATCQRRNRSLTTKLEPSRSIMSWLVFGPGLAIGTTMQSE